MTQNFNKKYGPWALVTGASSGMGREFAIQLAKKGINLVLTGRSEQQLQITANKIKNVETHIIPLDLTAPDFLTQLAEQVGERQIGLLICAAGIGQFGHYIDIDPRQTQQTIDLNIRALTLLTLHFGQIMSENNGGGIIVVSSGLGAAPIPFGAVYSATKSFISLFGQALAVELQPKNIDVLTLIPGGTKTEMVEKIGQSLDIKAMGMPMGEVQPVISAALRDLGNKSKTLPTMLDKIMVFMMARLFSSGFSAKLMGGMIFKSLRH